MSKSLDQPGKGRRKRLATEAAIIAAFDRLVRRLGLREVGVNAVVKEAGVGKGLLYKYFGGLPGLVKIWGERNKLWPDSSELKGLPDSTFANLSTADQIKTLIRNHAGALRDSPVGLDVLADELMAPSEISGALAEARRKLGTEHQAIFEEHHAMRDYDHRSLMMILLAAANYLAMRAGRSPRYMGEFIDSDTGWEDLMTRFDRVIELAALGSVRETTPEA